MHINVIGIGAGDPSYLTLQAIEAVGACDAFLIPDKGEDKTDLRAARLAVIARYARNPHLVDIAMPDRERRPMDYSTTIDDWHARIADAYGAALQSLREPQIVGLLVWGDPSLYDSTLRILETLRQCGHVFDLTVSPGITAIQALCARHNIPLNAIGEAVLVTTGRKLVATMQNGIASVVVMLDGEQAYMRVTDDVDIFWGAYLGTADEILIAGHLADVKHRIVEARTQARAAKGWIMDTYLLRRRS